MVTDPKWYVAIVTEQSSAFQQGMHYPVFIGNAEESEIGCLENIVTERNSSVLVFSFEKNVEKSLDIRTATIHIGERFAGYEVPSSYVKNGTITVKNQQDRQEIAVEVLYDNGETAILQETPALKAWAWPCCACQSRRRSRRYRRRAGRRPSCSWHRCS